MRCGPNSLTLRFPFFSRPNHKPQTWFHELTHGTGRHRDDRPYVVTRHNPTQAQSSRDAIFLLSTGPQHRTQSGRPGLAVHGFHFAERPSLGPRKFSLCREEVGIRPCEGVAPGISTPPPTGKEESGRCGGIGSNFPFSEMFAEGSFGDDTGVAALSIVCRRGPDSYLTAERVA